MYPSILFMTEHHLCWRSSSFTTDDPSAAFKAAPVAAAAAAAAAAADTTCCLRLVRQKLIPLRLQQQHLHLYAHMLQQKGNTALGRRMGISLA